MTGFETFLLIFITWSFIGGIICVFWNVYAESMGWELCNPLWMYRQYTNVNWFGATMLSLLYTFLCPIGAICYWFYKLCTVGRR